MTRGPHNERLFVRERKPGNCPTLQPTLKRSQDMMLRYSRSSFTVVAIIQSTRIGLYKHTNIEIHSNIKRAHASPFNQQHVSLRVHRARERWTWAYTSFHSLLVIRLRDKTTLILARYGLSLRFCYLSMAQVVQTPRSVRLFLLGPSDQMSVVWESVSRHLLFIHSLLFIQFLLSTGHN